jgi:BMFP domain-containing protein YqiC
MAADTGRAGLPRQAAWALALRTLNCAAKSHSYVAERAHHMTTTQTRFFDELAKLMTNAAGAAQGVRREIDTLVQAQMERVLNSMDLVKRDEFEAVKAMAQKAREENDVLSLRLAALEAKFGNAPESASDIRAD